MKKVLDSRLGWDLFQGPIYNRLIDRAADDLYRLVVSESNPPDGSRVLDIGCGPGFVSLRIAEAYPSVTVTGIDYSDTQVKSACKLSEKRGALRCDFLRGDAMDLPFYDSSFFTVVSVASIKHWPDPVRGLKEIRRVLSPGGLAVVAEADRDCSAEELDRFAKRFKSWFVYGRFMRWYLGDVVFGRSLTPGEAEGFARAAGFDQAGARKMEGWPFFTVTLKR